jgi:hypothetical protein
MFFKPPQNKKVHGLDALKTWETTYNCIWDERLYPVTVKIAHTVPGCEILSVDFLSEPSFEEIRIADMARQSICQQAINEFCNYADNAHRLMKRTTTVDDPFFEEA